MLAMIFAFAYCSTSHAATVEAMALLDHTSNLIRGCPRHCEQRESTQDYIAGGITITAGKNRAWEFDITHGTKRIDCGEWETGSGFAMRYYPGRKRRQK